MGMDRLYGDRSMGINISYLWAPPLPPTSFFAYWFPSFMAFETVPKGFEKYGGWGEACTLPIDARTCIYLQTVNYVVLASSRIDISYLGGEEAAKFQNASKLECQG